MSEKPEILQLGNPLLYEKSKPVEAIQSREALSLMELLASVCSESRGVGLAAPQIGLSKRMFIVSSKPNARYPSAPYLESEVMINPVITARSDEMERGWEGCLSIPGIRGAVPRHAWINIDYYNKKGSFVSQRFNGFVARIIQHEYDHLDGLVYLDRIGNTRDIITEKEYYKIVFNSG